jgi:transcriptional regulator with XRE-family HTH domain
MIDETQTREFPEFCQHLLAAKRGDLSIREQIIENGREARANLDRMLSGSSTLSRGIEQMQQTYTPTELKSLRQRKGLTQQLEDKLVRDVLLLAGELMKQHPSVTDIPRDRQIRNTFLFRFALCASVSILKRIEEGGAGKVSDENLRNDMVDVNFAAFATYFDGLFTSDKRAADTYGRSIYLLREMFAIPRPWSLASLIVWWRGRT